MIELIKKIIKVILRVPAEVFAFSFFVYERLIKTISFDFGHSLRETFIKKIENETSQVCHQTKTKLIKFNMYTPNGICAFRSNTFSKKEPEILEWIEEYGGAGALYDIGANIGIYSLFYSKKQTGKVFSFEPSAFNLRQLVKNVNLNNQSEKITIISNPLTEKSGEAVFINSNTDEGGALSAFGVTYGYDGNPIPSTIKSRVIGFSLDDLLKMGVLNEFPRLVKIDVDGIEHLILKGAKKTLTSSSCKSVYIEVNDDFKEQALTVKRLLTSYGFKLRHKKHSDMFEGNEFYGSIFNQIWVKK